MDIETAAELADRLKVSRAHIYNLLARGLPSIKVGRCRRFRRIDVDKWLDESQALVARGRRPGKRKRPAPPGPALQSKRSPQANDDTTSYTRPCEVRRER
jgi:excisionase family DNA binding protein